MHKRKELAPRMKLRIKKLEDVAVVDTGGDILMVDEDQFRQALLGLLSEGCLNIVVNFAETDYLCSSSLGILAMIIKRVRERGGDLKLTNLSSKVRKFFEVTRLEQMLEIFESVEEAVKSFRVEDEEEDPEELP